MNRRKDERKIADRELRRNGSGCLDPTAYEAIKRADRGPYDKNKKRQYYVGPSDEPRSMPLSKYIKWKLKVLDELGLALTEEETRYLSSLRSEAEVDAYAHRLIMNKE